MKDYQALGRDSTMSQCVLIWPRVVLPPVVGPVYFVRQRLIPDHSSIIAFSAWYCPPHADDGEFKLLDFHSLIFIFHSTNRDDDLEFCVVPAHVQAYHASQ